MNLFIVKCIVYFLNTGCAYILFIIWLPSQKQIRIAPHLCIAQGHIQDFWRGVDLIILLCILYLFRQTVLSKQCRPWSDATECGIWSGSTLFATHPEQTFFVYIQLAKRTCWREVSGKVSQIYPKCPVKIKFCIKRGIDWTPLNPPPRLRYTIPCI